MQYDIKLVKLVSGETVMGNYDSKTESLLDVVMVQTVPTSTGSIQLAMLPFGFPYEQEITSKIDGKHIMYEYTSVPEEMKTKYLEAKSNIKIASASSLDKIGGSDNGGGIIL